MNTNIYITRDLFSVKDNPDNEKSKWYDRVYLCYEDTKFTQSNRNSAIEGFICYRYNSFKNADLGWRNSSASLHKLNLRHTMIPICKWVPEMFDKYILNWKLRKMYWGGKISIYRGFYRYK
jgi:hypothetical protein